MINKNFGCHGGRVLRATRVGILKKIRGAILTCEETSSMPYRNRIALSNSSKIEFFPDPESMKPALTTAEKNQIEMERLEAQEAQEAITKATARLEKAKTPATIKKAETALQKALDSLAELTASADNKKE